MKKISLSVLGGLVMAGGVLAQSTNLVSNSAHQQLIVGNVGVTPVPKPASLALLALGVAGLAALRMRQQRLRMELGRCVKF